MNNSNMYRWKGKHREHVAIYEEAYGPVPEGFHVHHIDGDPSHNDLSNLIAVSPEDHRRLHAGWEVHRGAWWKPCSKCGSVLPLDNFYKRKTGTAEYVSQCKSCRSSINAKVIPMKLCKQCGEEFQPTFEQRDYCSKCNSEISEPDVMKVCSKCGKSYPKTTEFFKRCRGKLTGPCRQCSSAARRKRAHQHESL